MMGVIDFHSHILPGIDDGSASVEESVAMLQMEAEQGIAQVVATPHFYAHRDRLDCFLENRAKAEQSLRAEMAKHTGLPAVHIGAEVFFFKGISESREIEGLTIAGTRYIMVEMPHTAWTENMYCELAQMHDRQGLIPIIAHMDRYISRFRTFGIPEKLAALPVLVQANGEFFLNKRTASLGMRLLREGKIHLLGSDCHNLDTRKPNLGETLQKLEKNAGPTVLAQITESQQLVFPAENKM